jgi:Tfp pilus assembly protein PilO
MSAPIKITIGIIIIAVMGAVFYFISWKTSYENIASYAADIVKANEQLSTIRDQKKQIPQLQDDQRKLQDELRAVIQEQLTPGSESEFVPSYIADIERLVEQQRVRMGDPDFLVYSITPDTGSSKESGRQEMSGYPVRGFQMSLTGRYATVIDFLRQLGALKLKRLVTVSKLSLSVKQAPENYFESPILNVTLPISVYFREEGGKK